VALLRLPYVRTYRDRHGRLRRYLRRRGHPDVPLPGDVGSEEFMRAYQSALETPRNRPSPHAAGTLARLIEDYYGSVEFANLKPSSRALYRLVLDPLAVRDGHRLVRDMPRDKVRKIIEEIGAIRPGMANLTRKALRRLLTYAIDAGWRTDNPVSGIKAYKLGSRHTWTDQELSAFEARWPLGTRQRLAYTLLLYTGQRVGDVVRMRRHDISNGYIGVVQQKTGAALVIPIHPKLHEALKAGPANGMSLIGDRHGRAITAPALTNMMKRAVEAAGLSRECLPHGLRKALLRRLAEHGGSAKEIAAVSGHKSLGEVERYTAAADQRKLSAAAMAKLTEDEK
jgi:enterobacteria phage integrase